MATSTIYSFPDDYINPSEKDSKWGLQVAQAIWAHYSQNITCWGSGQTAQFEANILYSNGMQPMSQYVDILCPPDKGDSKTNKGGIDSGTNGTKINDRKNYAFLAKKIVSPMPKMKELMLGLLEEIDHDVYAESVDEMAITEREKRKHTMWVKSLLMPTMQKMEKQNGIPAPKMQFRPDTWEDLQMYEMMGGFTLAREIALEQATRQIMRFSEWKKIARQWRESLWDNGKAVGRVVFDPYQNQVRLQYVPLTQAVIGDRGSDVKNPIPYAGHKASMSIKDIESRLFGDGETDKDVIESIINSCHKQSSNTQYSSFSVEDLVSKRQNNGDFMYQSMMVEVFHWEYISSDRTYKTERKNAEGVSVYHPDEYGKVRDSDKRKTKIIDKTCVYQGIWLIDTQHILNFQKVQNQIKPDKNRTVLSYFYQEINGLSKAERCIGFVDAYMLSFMKLQAAKAAAAPKGIAIDINSLAGVSLGSGKTSPLELIRIRRQTGSQLYKSFQLHNSVVQKLGAPITELEGGVGKQLEEWTYDMGNNLNAIFEATGFNDVSAASPDQSPQQGYGVSQIAMDQTNNSLKPIYECMTDMKTEGSNLAMRKLVVLINFDSLCKSTYSDIIGKKSVEAIMTTLNIPLEALGLKMVAKPSQHEINTVRENVKEALRVGKNGQPLITLADATIIDRWLNQGKVKESEMYLVYRTAQTERENDEKSAMGVQQQSQAMMEQEAKKLESELMKIKAKGASEIEVLEKKKEVELAIEAAKTEGRIKELEAEALFESTYGTDVRNQRN
jgi:hypothetical protein